MDHMATASVLRFPQGVRRAPRELTAQWRRGWYFGARAALLDLPGALIFVLPRRATATGRRYWYVARVAARGYGEPEVYCCTTRRAVRDTVQRQLASLGWEAVL